jgi:hypothetical protein
MYGRTGWKTLLSGAALYDTASWQGISPTVHQSTAIKFNSKPFLLFSSYAPWPAKYLQSSLKKGSPNGDNYSVLLL